jgi:hypothetical protein
MKMNLTLTIILIIAAVLVIAYFGCFAVLIAFLKWAFNDDEDDGWRE